MSETEARTTVELASGVYLGERWVIDGVTVICTSVEYTSRDEDGVPTFTVTTRPVTDAD